jgi:hypothetical protein
MGRAGRQRVEHFFDLRRMMAAYERLYSGDWQSDGTKERVAMAGDLAEAR